MAGGYSTFLADSMAGTGIDAPSYSNVLGGGFALGVEIRFALMPVLSAGVSFFNFTLDGTHYYPPSQPNLDYFFGPYGNSLGINQLAVNVKVRLPLLLWNLSGSHLRMSRAEEITGVLLFFKVGAGPAFWTQYMLMVRDNDTGNELSNLVYYGKTTNFSVNFGGGIEVRWKWGSIEAGLMIHDFGTPESAWPPKSDSEPLSMIDFRLGLGIHF